jgi:hypothetical protein
MKRQFVIAVFILAVITLGWLEARGLWEQADRTRAFSVVTELGGQIGGLTPPVPFSGSEYRVRFRGTQFRPDQVGRLAALNVLTDRNHVGIMFEDTNATAADVRRLRGLMPKCRIVRVIKGQIVNDD